MRVLTGIRRRPKRWAAQATSGKAAPLGIRIARASSGLRSGAATRCRDRASSSAYVTVLPPLSMTAIASGRRFACHPRCMRRE